MYRISIQIIPSPLKTNFLICEVANVKFSHLACDYRDTFTFSCTSTRRN